MVRKKSEIVRYEKIYNKCILENLFIQSDKEVIKIIKDAEVKGYIQVRLTNYLINEKNFS